MGSNPINGFGIGEQEPEPEPIAIVGIAFEFPQEATTEESFWQMISNGRSAHTDFPKDRVNIDAFYHPDDGRNSTLSVRGGNFLKEDLGVFDAPFFSITPGEASCMDPQHRRMLETAYHALEDAGVPLDKCSGSDTSVYTGCFTNDYLSVLQQDYESEQRHAAMGIAPSMLATRVSWFFNLKGTSMNLDSACSSSLVALHLACQDLRARTTSMALVGGANLVYHPDFMKMMTTFKFLSPDSRSWSFDHRANGYSRGEGLAVVIVKRLADALRDGDTIRCVIRGTGTNQDGRTPGITQPSQVAQVELIERTYKQSNIDMEPTRFFEAHGTGTKVGDPVEANAIGMAFGKYRTEDDPLYIGAVKANLGHLEGCSGLAGIIKTILVLERGIIPPIAGFESLNDKIDDKKLHLHFAKSVIPWPTAGLRRACVNSFGFGGTNATIILDDARNYLKLRGLHGNHRTDEVPKMSNRSYTKHDSHSNIKMHDGIEKNGDSFSTMGSEDERISLRPRLLIWSSSDEKGVQQMSKSYLDYISQNMSEIDDLAYTLAVRRSHFAWRSFAVPDPHNQTSLAQITSSKTAKRIAVARIAFVFTGQGANYWGMGSELIIYPAFRKSLEISQQFLEGLDCSWSILEVINGENQNLPIAHPQYSQPMTTCLQIALVELFKSFGISPSTVLGHSSGEIAAAYAAGALSHASAVKVAYYRGVLSSKLLTGIHELTMMAVGISRAGVIPYLERLHNTDGSPNVQIGCVNSPSSVTLTGEAKHLTTLEQWFKEDSIFVRKLQVPIAYHSSFMEPIAKEYHSALGKLQKGRNSGFVPMISSVTKDFIPAGSLIDPSYWVRNMTSTVEFEDACLKLLALSETKPRKQLGRNTPHKAGVTYVLEVGPHSALEGPIRETFRSFTGPNKPLYTSALVRKENAITAILRAVGSLHCAGCPVDILKANNLEESSRPIPAGTPKYSFNHRQSYWIESRLSKNFRFRKSSRHDLLGTRSLDWNMHMAQWRNVMRLSEIPWLEDHKINGEIIFPGAGMVVMAMEALKQLVDNTTELHEIQLKDVDFLHPMIFPRDTERVETQLNLETQSTPSPLTLWSQFRLLVIDNNDYVECCRGFIKGVLNSEESPGVPFLCGKSPSKWMEEVSASCQGPERDPYNLSTGTAIQYGPCFRNLEHMTLSDGREAIAEINTSSWKARPGSTFSQGFVVHPSVLDALAQLVVPSLAQGTKELPLMVPAHADLIGINCSTSHHHLLKSGNIRAAAKSRFRGYRGASADLIATSIDSETELMYIQGLETTFISSAESHDIKQQAPRTLCTRLIWKPDIDLLSTEQLLLECTKDRPPEATDMLAKFKLQTLAIMSFVVEAAKVVNESSFPSMEPHLVAYVDWMRYQLQRLRDEELPVKFADVERLLNNSKNRENVTQQVEAFGAADFFLMQVGRNLIKILRNELDPLQLFFENGLVDRYYEEMLSNEHDSHPASAYIDLLSFKNPSMRILEIGAGTGGQTLRTLETLASSGVNKWSRYDYTDISPRFFEDAKTKFHEHSGGMSFRVCDISKDPVSQSFEAGSYDLIIASSVLHATERIDQSLRNVRKLLKPGGKVLMVETTHPESLHIGFPFGLLKGWWNPLQYEPRSLHSPCLTTQQWKERLTRAGFSGIDLEIKGQTERQCQYSSIIVSTATSVINGESKISPEIAVVVDTQIGEQLAIAKLLTIRLANCKMYDLAALAEADLSSSMITVSLLEVNSTCIDGISATNYDYLRTVLLRYKNTIWVTKTRSGELEPQHHLADGLGRVLSSEDSTRKFVTLALDVLDQDPEQIMNPISDLISRVAMLPVDQLETTIVASHHGLEVCRVSENSHMNLEVAKAISPRQNTECQLTPGNSLSLRIEHPGQLNTVGWMSDESSLASNSLGDDEVLIEVRAIGLTFKDFLVASGHLNELDLGTDCAGVILAAGKLSGFEPGERVCALGSLMARSITHSKADAVCPIGSDISFAEAASLPTAIWLSYHALVDLARVQKGDAVLIYQATSSVGQMAIQLARKLGAHVYVTTSSESKGKYLTDKLNIPKISILTPEDAALPIKVHHSTKGRGVDVVVGPLSSSNVADFSECLSPFGRLIDTSLTSEVRARKMPSKSTPLVVGTPL